MKTPNNLVYADEHGLVGWSFYWLKHEQYGLTEEELEAVGVSDARVRIHRDLVEPLKAVQKELLEKGYDIRIEDGYRSPELYELVYKKRTAKFGKEQTDKIFNVRDMPHATGRAVDIALWNPEIDTKVFMRDGRDDPDAFIYGFYKDRTDPDGIHYQALQDLLIDTMKRHGFTLGSLNEYFHFNYKI